MWKEARRLSTIIVNGRVVDPASGFDGVADVVIRDGKIWTVGHGAGVRPDRVLDAGGLVVAPGFIDIHMHREDELEGEGLPSDTNEMAWYLAHQGVTTAVGGNCGWGPTNPGPYLESIAKRGTPINFMVLAGHLRIRQACGIEDPYQTATGEQIRDIARVCRDAVAGGAAGVSVGLEYTPGASFDELVAVGRAIRDLDRAILAVHYRYDGDRALESIDELVAVAGAAGVAVQISHINSCAAFGLMKLALTRLSEAVAQGLDISADAYPYDAFCTYVGSAVFDEGCFDRWGVEHGALLVATGPHAGQRCSPELFAKLRAEDPRALIVAFVMREQEVREAVVHPLVMVASDGLTRKGQGHPRGSGTFPRVLGLYCREWGMLSLPQALRKMTIMPAQRLGLEAKGRIQEGADADIVVFDPAAVVDRATFEDPTQRPTGIRWVLVNGEVVIDDGRTVSARAGRVILRAP